VTYPTAHRDLADLYQRGLLDRHKVGKQHRFVPVPARSMKLFDSLWGHRRTLRLPTRSVGGCRPL